MLHHLRTLIISGTMGKFCLINRLSQSISSIQRKLCLSIWTSYGLWYVCHRLPFHLGIFRNLAFLNTDLLTSFWATSHLSYLEEVSGSILKQKFTQNLQISLILIHLCMLSPQLSEALKIHQKWFLPHPFCYEVPSPKCISTSSKYYSVVRKRPFPQLFHPDSEAHVLRSLA